MNYDLIKSAYGEDPMNWGNLKIFEGDFINFGSWKDIYLENYFYLKFLAAIDITPAQIERATINSSLLLEDPKKIKFALEARRVLKNNGHLLLTTFLTNSNIPLELLIDLIPFYRFTTDNPISIVELEFNLRSVGFNSIQIQRIGLYVFLYYVRWTHQVMAENTGTYNYFTAYNMKLIDYFVIIAK